MSSEATVERVLRLLSLLQRRPVWTAGELAEECGITDRSVRRDIERLRTLGYPVQCQSFLTIYRMNDSYWDWVRP